ncbi:MAG: hypothetical protein KDB80_16315 [Planctomycetes bacterium]|nr:hypothetical protein [Planctomycetota bacterium]
MNQIEERLERARAERRARHASVPIEFWITALTAVVALPALIFLTGVEMHTVNVVSTVGGLVIALTAAWIYGRTRRSF